MNTEPDTVNQCSDRCKCKVFYSPPDGPPPWLRCDVPDEETTELPCIRWRGHFGMCSSQVSRVCGHRLDQHYEHESPSSPKSLGRYIDPGECLLCSCAGFDSVEDELARRSLGTIEVLVPAMANVERDDQLRGWLAPTWEELIGHSFEQLLTNEHIEDTLARPAISLVLAEPPGPPRSPIDALRAFQQREMMMAPVDMTLKAWRMLWNGLLGEVWWD